MKMKKMALAMALLLAATSTDVPAVVVHGADFSSEIVSEEMETPEEEFLDESGMEQETAEENAVFSDIEDIDDEDGDNGEEDVEDNTTYTLSEDGTLVIGGTGSIPRDKFSGNQKIVNVTISAGITEIGDGVFTGCSNLKSITIPEGVTRIGSGAFMGCSSLTEVTIPNGVKVIEGATFWNCSSLAKVVIPESVTEIQVQAFTNCTSLTSVEIPDYVETIGSGAFSGCTSLKDVYIGFSVTRTGDYAFSQTALETIEIPGSLDSIGNNTFAGCAKLRSIRCYADHSTWQAKYICEPHTTVYYNYKPIHTHVYELKVIKSNSCTAAGKGEEICKYCGDYYETEIPATGHDWSGRTSEKEATCEKDGEKVYYCRNCGAEKSEIIPATGHKWKKSIYSEPATCTDAGEDIYECANRGCSEEKRVKVEATGHKFSPWKVTQEATVYQEEIQERTCSECGETERKITRDQLTPTMKLSVSSIVLKKGQKTNCLKVTGLANGDSISYCYSDSSIVDVTNNGNGAFTVVAGDRTGKTQLIVVLDSGYRKTISVKVQKGAVKTTKITGIPKTLKLKKNQKYSLKPVLAPVTSKEKITYKSSSSKIVKVDSKGRITAKKKGKAVITVKSGKKTVKCTVTVK